MRSAVALNTGAFVLALGASIGTVWLPTHRVALANTAGAPSAGASSVAASGAVASNDAIVPSGFVDHAGTVIPRRDYRRIVSASLVADAVLLEICEPDRIVAVTGHSAREPTRGYRYAGKETIERLENLETILSFHPDLVFVAGIVDDRRVARLRDAGLVVYDLGDMRGMSTLIPNVHEIAAIVGHPERGDRYARTLTDQMNAVAADVPPTNRPRGMYLSAYGGRLFGGASNTSYHDVLVAAGLVDAASRYRDWPEYTTEQILTLDPDVIVLGSDMRDRVCGHSGLESLRACRRAGGVVEVDAGLLADAGPAMVDAAWAVREAAHGAAPASRFGSSDHGAL